MMTTAEEVSQIGHVGIRAVPKCVNFAGVLSAVRVHSFEVGIVVGSV